MDDDLNDIKMEEAVEEPRQEEEEIGLPPGARDAQANPALAPIVQALQLKGDHTPDKIDWKACYEEDCKRAEDLCVDKKWDPLATGRPEEDLSWCFACRFKQKSAAQASGVLGRLNDYNNASYGTVQMLDLVDGLQDIFIKFQLKRMQRQSPQMRFWFRRTIYDHLHGHNRTPYVDAHVRKRRYQIVSDDLWDARTHRDILTGAETPNFKAIPLMMKTDSQCSMLTDKITKMMQNGTVSSF